MEMEMDKRDQDQDQDQGYSGGYYSMTALQY
jgi:hypothetical protein